MPSKPPRSITARLPLAIALAAAVAVAGCEGREADIDPPSGAVAERYVRYCAACHGPEGRTIEGMPAVPLLRGQGLLTTADDAFLHASIAGGRPGENGRGKPGTKMTAFDAAHRGPLEAPEIDELVAYIRAWQTEPSIALDPAWRTDGDAAAGKAVFVARCASCHGADGWGDAAPRLAGETLQAAASDDFLRQTILRGRPGSAMVAFDLSAEAVADVVAYIRTLGPAEAGG